MKQTRRMLSILLCVTLVLSGVYVPAKEVHAEEIQATTTTETIKKLGVSMIADPLDPGEDTTQAWKGSYVYYGNYDADGDGTAEPVKYRVLDASTTDYSEDETTQTMLLDCDSILHKQVYDSSNAEWASSAIKRYLNSEVAEDASYDYSESGFLTTSFTNVEQSAIAASTKTEANALDGTKQNAYKFEPLSGESIFILDLQEATRVSYGYSSESSGATNRVKKLNGASEGWWLRSAYASTGLYAGYVVNGGEIMYMNRPSGYPGVSPALNLNLSSVLFSSVILGTAGAAGAEYKLTLLDSDMTIAPKSGVTKDGNVVTIPYGISGTNSGNASQVSVLILDKEYTVGNVDGASILAYEKLNVQSFSETGTGTYTIPDSLSGKKAGTDYHIYIVAEDINGEKETDYASAPVEIYLWEAPTVKEMNFGTSGIIDPAIPNAVGDAWKGCYVYYGNYDVASDGTAEPVKYRVLDASTTDYSGDEATQTMLLDCDSILYSASFDEDGAANETGKYANDWSVSDIQNGLNGTGGFIDVAFTATEKSAIATSTKAAKSDLDGAGREGSSYTPLTGQGIFLLDSCEATRATYGYSVYDDSVNRVKKLRNTASIWWLRSAQSNRSTYAIYVDRGGFLTNESVEKTYGVSPALNLDLSSVLLSSVSGTSKASLLGSGSNATGETTDTEWKLTLLDTDKAIALTQGRNVTKASDGTITVPYTYTDSAALDSEKVNQISVMITDEAYGSENAQILYYGALDNIKNAVGSESTVTEASTGIGTFVLPSGLTGTWGTDYHVYVLAEHVNADNSTDYASSPLEIGVKTSIATVEIPSIAVPVTGFALETELEISQKGVAANASVVWKKGETTVAGNAEANTTYQALVTLTAVDGYTFVDAAGVVASVTLSGKAVDAKMVALNGDGTLTVACGEYTTESDVTVSGSKVSINNDGTVTYVAPANVNATAVTVPDTVIIGGVSRKVTAIAKNAFKNSKIKTITIGNNIKTIGANAFYGCKKLKTVRLGKNVTTIGDKAFYQCIALTKITIPAKVKTIGKYAFYGCRKLKSVTIGKSVRGIGTKAFYGCTKLKTLTIKSTKLTTKRVGSKAFGKTPKSMTVKIPKKKFKAYKSMLIKKGVNKKAKFKKG